MILISLTMNLSAVDLSIIVGNPPMVVSDLKMVFGTKPLEIGEAAQSFISYQMR